MTYQNVLYNYLKMSVSTQIYPHFYLKSISLTDKFGAQFFNTVHCLTRVLDSLGLDVLERLSASHDCACEGACGCMRPVSAEPLRRIHSTWSPTSYTLQALDIYFNQLERGSKSCLPGKHVPFKLSNSNGLSLSISMSVDNLKDIV